ncbi:MAG: hypothetical protein RL283_1052 [Actinomycetota bacterium]|jgi:putative endonuclease
MRAAVPDRSRVAHGRWAEDLVARRYERDGWRVLDRRWRVRGGELDLVVARGPLVAFVEVKARRRASHGSPFEAVTATKQRRLRAAAAAWLARRRDAHGIGPAVRLRFDVAAVTGARVEVREAAF